ncbi:MAG: GldM family protein [Ferruginibacter sp.]
MKCLSIILSLLISAVCVSAQSVVAVDKMNVLYYGIDNPITIGAPNDLRNAAVNITNGTISGSGSQRIVRPASVDQKTTITIDIQGKKTSYDFRVKNLPDPVFKIGSGKTRMPVIEFKSQVFCRVDMGNFEYDCRYEVVSADVYFSGENFPEVVMQNLTGYNLSVLKKSINECMPGTTVTFDNIKVQGPDGIRTIDGRSFFLY